MIFVGEGLAPPDNCGIKKRVGLFRKHLIHRSRGSPSPQGEGKFFFIEAFSLGEQRAEQAPLQFVL